MPSGSWSITARAYHSNVATSSAPAALRLIEMAHSLEPISGSSYVLDNGAGTGVVTRAITAQYPLAQVLATDLSAQMLSVIDAEHLPNVKTKALDACHLSKELEPATFSHVFSTFMLQFITDPLAAVREMYTVLRPEGIVGIGVWALGCDVFTIWNKACLLVDPSFEMPSPFPDRSAWRTEEDLRAALSKTGFTDLSFDYCRMKFEVDSGEHYVQFWFGEKNPSASLLIDAYQGDLGPVRRAMEQVVREQYGNGKEIYVDATVGIGRKEG